MFFHFFSHTNTKELIIAPSHSHLSILAFQTGGEETRSFGVKITTNTLLSSRSAGQMFSEAAMFYLVHRSCLRGVKFRVASADFQPQETNERRLRDDVIDSLISPPEGIPGLPENQIWSSILQDNQQDAGCETLFFLSPCSCLYP